MPVRRGRRWRRIALWAAGALLALAVVLYASLPWWVPKRYLAERFARVLAGQLGLPVSIGRLDLSWNEGIVLEDFRIGQDQAFGEGDMVRVGGLRCDLSPLRLLLTNRLQWAEIHDAELHVVVNERRQVNLAALQRLSGGSLPERLVVQRAVLTVRLPQQDRLLRLDVGDLQYRSGRLERLGRITMSAGLAQEGGPAPVSLDASAGAKGAPVAAACHFQFVNLDVAQLGLPALLGLPLKRLAGEGSGRLDCRLNSAGIVDELALAIRVKDLDAQPLAGPALPVVKEAEISLDAIYEPPWDPLNPQEGRFEARNLHLRLPGMDLEGRVVTRGRSWQDIGELKVSGRIDPATVSALISGKPVPLPGGFLVEGDVEVLSLEVVGKGDQLTSSVSLDATKATVRQGQRLVKPPGTILTADLRGVLSRQNWDISAGSVRVQLGENYLTGTGAMKQVGEVLDRWLKAGASATVRTLLDDLAALEWSGSGRICELKTLRGLLGSDFLDQVHLKGWVEGTWSVKRSGTVLLHAGLRAPAETELAVGRWFAKPDGQPVDLDLAGEVDIQAAELTRFSLAGRVGQAGVFVDEGSLTFPVDAASGQDDQGLCLRLDGRYSLRDAAALAACVPAARGRQFRISGDAGGQFHLLCGPSLRRGHLQLNATLLDLAAGEDFQKASGQPADLVADLCCDDKAPAAERNRLWLDARLGGETLQADLTFPSAGDGDSPVRWSARLRVADAAWLLGRVPRLQARLRPYEFSGGLAARLEGEIAKDQVRGEIVCDADDLGFRLPAWGGMKGRGSALRLRLAGQYGPREATVNLLAVDLGRSSLSCEGTFHLGRSSRPEAANSCWPEGVQSAALAVRGRVAPDAALVSLAPVLRRTVERFALDGSARVEIGLRGDGQTVELVGKADASDLAIAAEGTFAKPAGLPLRGEFAASVPADASAIHLRDLVVEGADFQFRADATIGLLKEQPPASHLALNVPRLRRFSSRVPFLEPYAVEGSLFLEAELTAREGRPLAKYVTVTAGDLIGVLGGKACRLDGSVTLEQVGWDGQSISIGRLVTAGLGLALGNSRGFLVADVRDPLTAPAGEAELLCPDLDVYDLSQWESPRPPALSPLTSQQGEALGRQADEFVARLRRLVLPADARLRMKMDRMRYYDSEVKAMYEVRSMVAEVEARKGLLRASFRAALNGGDMEQNYRVNLDDPQPRLSVQGDMREVMSGEHVLAQLAKEFPGNTVYGTFSRSQDLTYRLRDVVINCLDGRFRPVAVGEARFLTEDGLLRGRAAPRFIANIFPGLNLAPYRYRRMTGFTGYNADGSSDSDMIFGGTAYDLYIEGTTDAQRIGRYEIGVILVGTPQSAEFNHKFRLGRIPVLKFKARIEGGQFYDEEVWYPYPTETAFRIFLKNNIFYRLWLDSLRRGGSRAIIPGPATAPAGGK